MKIRYDPETDILVIELRDERIKESDEVRPGVIADFGYDDGIVRFEVLDASKRVSDPRSVTLAATGWSRDSAAAARACSAESR